MADSILAVICCEAKLDNTAVQRAGSRHQNSFRTGGYGMSHKVNVGVLDCSVPQR